MAAWNPDRCDLGPRGHVEKRRVTVKVGGLWQQTYEIQEKRTFIFLSQPSVTFINPPSALCLHSAQIEP